jgi:hypothetical protein
MPPRLKVLCTSIVHVSGSSLFTTEAYAFLRLGQPWRCTVASEHSVLEHSLQDLEVVPRANMQLANPVFPKYAWMG